MDVLSDAITVMRAGRPHANRYELYAPWGMRFPDGQGAGFHVVLQGSCWLLPPEGAPIRLGAGDVALLHGTGIHGIAGLTWWRMTIAARLLRESDLPLRTVARRTGYSSDIAFAAAFKREYGITPGHYRATCPPVPPPSADS